MRARDVMVRAVATTTPDTTVETVAKLIDQIGRVRSCGVVALDRHGAPAA